MKTAVVTLIFEINQKKILLIKRRDVPVWVLPGGGVEKHETPHEAAIREVYEEANIHLTGVKKLALYNPINRLTHKTYLFQAVSYSGILKATTESQEVAFFDVNALPKDLFFIHKEMIDLALTNPVGEQTLSFTQVTYFRLAKYFVCHPLQVIRFLLSQAGFPINTK
jgi:ADP-ribose pyrophosphatase YjhB (NUDIX family)